MKRVVTALVTVVAIALAVGGCGGDGESALLGYVPPTEKTVAGVSVTEVTDGAAGAPFSFEAAPGEVLVVYFGYTNCPDLCPTTLYAVRTARRRIGDLGAKVDLAMVTVDPERDTAQVLPMYLSSFADRYHALVPASEAELRAAEEAFRASSMVTKKPDGTVDVAHSSVAYVVDDTGHVVVEWPFGLEADAMANDLRLLLGGKA